MKLGHHKLKGAPVKIEAFVSRELREITEDEWLHLTKSREYRTIREYGNRQFHIRAMWNGKLDYYAKNEADAKAKFKPFDLIVLDSKDGQARHRTADSSKYATESEVINAYEDFLVRHRLAYWAPSTIEGEFHFIEQGNLMKATGDTPAVMGDSDDVEVACSW